MITRKTIALTTQAFAGKVMSLLFTMLSRLVIAFLPRTKNFLISWLQSPSTVIMEPKKIKICHCFPFSPSVCHEVIGLNAMILVFWMLSFKPAFSFSSFTVIKRLSSSSSIYAIRVVPPAYLRYHNISLSRNRVNHTALNSSLYLIWGRTSIPSISSLCL